MFLSSPHFAIAAAVCLASFVGLDQAPARAEDEDRKIRLLSTEDAERCIQDEACMHDLFLGTTLGGMDSAVLKTTKASYAALFPGTEVPLDLLASTDIAMTGVSVLANAAGADLKIAEKGSDQPINLMILMSDDFTQDRDRAFKKLLTDVFAGQTEAYDALASDPSPVCRNHLFADGSYAIAGILAMVEIHADRAAVERCVHRLALNALGLRFPLAEGTDSVLDPTSTRTSWTAIDFMLLKLLYDPAIKPGMTRDQVDAVFPEAYARLLPSSS